MITEVQLSMALNQAKELLERLNELSLLKKEALLKDDLNQLKEIVRQEEVLGQEFKTINDACLSQVQFFLQEQSQSSQVSDWQQQLRNLRQLTEKLQVNNKFNLELIGDALALTQFTLNALTVPDQPKMATYNVSGRVVGNDQRQHLLDFKG